MSQLVIAAVVFVAGHVSVSSTPLRPWLIARLGLGPYLGVYSVAAIAALAWLIVAWRGAPHQPLWEATTFWQHLPYGSLLFACFLLVGGLAAPNPSLAGREGGGPADAGWRPRGVLTITRHPVMWAIGIWALVHVGANGDVEAAIFFGSLAVLALGGTILIDRRKDRQAPDRWAAVRAQTSNLPFVALLRRRARPRIADIAGVPLMGGIALYAVLVLLHPFIAGVPVPAPTPMP